MEGKAWKLQEAKNHFSEVVEQAMKTGPQEVTRRGEKAVVIISYAMYEELTKPKENLVEFFQNSPLFGVELDLEREHDYPREVDL